MGNPVRPWKQFLTSWEKIDYDAQKEYIIKAIRTLRQLRSHKHDLEKRIAYWQANLENAQRASRNTENKGRGREAYERVTRVKRGHKAEYKSRFSGMRETAE